MSDPGGWTATIRATRSSAAAAERLERTLGPESAREVPRTRAKMRRPEPRVVEVEITTKDTGALRAALQTFVGWVQLVDATEAAIVPEAARD